ncbi:MAG: nuclear transport factor 2 family protein [Alphaproteobacteria bacterium]|nr:nuclear transport factor 2 family protein [Alphaproteobacteria bacterium]
MKRLVSRTLYIVVISTVVSLSANVAARADDMTDLALKLLVEFTEAVLAGPETLAPILAPEYQIMRTNGVGYDRDGYLARGAGSVSAQPDFSHEELVVTAADDVLVVRYYLRIDETIDDKPVKKRAPRLTVFRKIGDVWKVVSHSNFGAAG